MHSDAITIELGPGRPGVTILRPRDQESLLARAVERGSETQPDGGSPYYAELWPAALPLAKWLLDERAVREGANVLELGCGLGLVGIALAKAASARVTVTDGSPEALELVRAAVAANAPYEHEPVVEKLDWRDCDATIEALGGRFPVVVGADVLYSPESFPALAKAAAASLRPDGILYLAEPQRPIARGAIALLEGQGLELIEKAKAENDVAVQTWSFPRKRGKKTLRCG